MKKIILLCLIAASCTKKEEVKPSSTAMHAVIFAHWGTAENFTYNDGTNHQVTNPGTNWSIQTNVAEGTVVSIEGTGYASISTGIKILVDGNQVEFQRSLSYIKLTHIIGR